MSKQSDERRKFERYDTEVKIYFDVKYDLKTKVKFQFIDKIKHKIMSRKYSALSKNVSAEGLCFISGQQLKKDDTLHIEVYLPGQRDPIHMEGTVEWSKSASYLKVKDRFETGVRLKKVNGKDVTSSVYRDEEHHLVWSVVLESILGSFKIFAQKRQK